MLPHAEMPFTNFIASEFFILYFDFFIPWNIFFPFSRWIEENGGKVVAAEGTDADTVLPCEISPLVSYCGEDLAEIVRSKTFTAPVSIN